MAARKKKATAKKKTVRKKKAAKKKAVRKKKAVARKKGPPAKRFPNVRVGIGIPINDATGILLPVEDGRIVSWVADLLGMQGVDLDVETLQTGNRKFALTMVGSDGVWPLVDAGLLQNHQHVWIPVTPANIDEIEPFVSQIDGMITLSTPPDLPEVKYDLLKDAVFALGGAAQVFPKEEPFDIAETEAIPLHTDDPAKVDRLGRATFAEAVANHVRRILDGADKDAGSLAIHLDGPWGSGKSSLLGMLAGELSHPRAREGEETPRPKWAVVQYNAWERQNEKPPWMGLLDTVYADAKKQLVEHHDRSGLGLALKRGWRRFGKWRMLVSAGIVLAAMGVGYGLFQLLVEHKQQWPAVLTGIAAGIGALPPLFKWFRKSMFPSTAEGAKRFASRQADPADAVRTHYEEMYDSLDVQLAIFLDDVDRCQPGAVVELLEGIQTLFRTKPVLFVVAGDRRWISKCFQMEYEDFAKMIPNPGHRLGDLFVQKVFQLSVRVPRISEQMQEQYLAHLLQAAPESVLAEQKMEAQELFEDANTEEEVQSRYEEGLRRGLPMDLVGQQAARRSSEAEIQERTEHALQRHAHLFERNPRAMKRMLNYYSIARATLYIEGVSEEQVTQEQLVRWLAAATRWPLLTDCLRIDPDIVELVGSTEVPADAFADIEMYFDEERRETIRGLLSDTNVTRVLGPMTPDVIRHCAAQLD